MRISPELKRIFLNSWFQASCAMLIGLALRLVRLYMDYGEADRDFYLYADMARLYSLGGWHAVYFQADANELLQPPFFYMFLAWANSIGIPFELAGYILNISCGVLLIGVSYWIARMLYRAWLPALLTSLLVATQYFLLRQSVALLRDSSYLLMFGLALAGVAAYRESWKIRWKYLYFCMFALGVLNRTEGMEILLLLPVLLGMDYFRFAENGRKRVWPMAHTLALFLAALLFLHLVSMEMGRCGSKWSAVSDLKIIRRFL